MNEERKQRAHLMVQRALALLADSLESGRSQNLRDFLQAVGRFHRYSLNNVCLILAQKPDATRVAGFSTWKTLGRSVRKGEKGLLILVPMVYRRSEQKAIVDEPEPRSLGFCTGFVFDVSQTEGEPLPEIGRVSGDPGKALLRLEAAYRHFGVGLERADGLGGAKGVSMGGKVRVLKGMEPAEEFSTLVHELAHELLHRSGRPEALSRRIRELEAEAAAYAVCSAVGLDPGTSSADYIHLYDGDAEALRASLGAVQKAAADILSRIDP